MWNGRKQPSKYTNPKADQARDANHQSRRASLPDGRAFLAEHPLNSCCWPLAHFFFKGELRCWSLPVFGTGPSPHSSRKGGCGRDVEIFNKIRSDWLTCQFVEHDFKTWTHKFLKLEPHARWKIMNFFSTAASLNRYPLDRMIKLLLLTTRTTFCQGGELRCWSLPPHVLGTPARRSTLTHTHHEKDHQRFSNL